jgi:hypothetical protein
MKMVKRPRHSVGMWKEVEKMRMWVVEGVKRAERLYLYMGE